MKFNMIKDYRVYAVYKDKDIIDHMYDSHVFIHSFKTLESATYIKQALERVNENEIDYIIV